MLYVPSQKMYVFASYIRSYNSVTEKIIDAIFPQLGKVSKRTIATREKSGRGAGLK
jgi:hypothetical protein